MEVKKEKKEYLYRIMSVKRVKELFEDGVLVFLKPEAWKDPFENYISKVSFIDEKRIKHHINYLKNVFGQCYSLGTETSLMWDAYTPNKDGVRIKIEKDKLIGFLNTQKQYPVSHFRFAKVIYKKYGDFVSKLKNNDALINLYRNQNNELIDFLFEKRYEYRDEREFRIMYDANNDGCNYGELLKINISVLDLIDSVRFDPKMHEDECNQLKVYFRSKGIDGRKIQRSLLYKYQIKKKVRI
jgi:hypothetical protein